MAIGSEGQFDVNGSKWFTFEEKYTIYIHPNVAMSYPDDANKLLAHVKQSTDGTIATESAF
jgi:hypothetical protein